MDGMKLSALVIGVLVVAGFYYGFNRLVTGVVKEATTDTSNCFEMIGNTTTEVKGQTRITGSIRNNCERKFLNMGVSFKVERTNSSGFAGFGGFNDKRSNTNNNSFSLPDSVVTASGRDLMPGGIWTFETSSVPRGASYRLEKMWGY